MEGPKKWIEVALMPLVIAIVGILGTYLITSEQREAAEIQAVTDRQVKILNIFADRIISDAEEERLLAIQLLLVMDKDLALKAMTTLDLREKETPRVKEAVKRVTSHAIALKLAEQKTGDAYRAAILEGTWLLWRDGTSINGNPTNWLEFKTAKSELIIEGNEWKGEVTFDGKGGYYIWNFYAGDHMGETGRTDFYLDETGILLGKVKGNSGNANFDWTYWGIRAPREIIEKK